MPMAKLTIRIDLSPSKAPAAAGGKT